MVLSVMESMMAQKRLSVDLLDSAISELDTFRSYALANAPLHFSIDWAFAERGKAGGTVGDAESAISSAGFAIGAFVALIPGGEPMGLVISIAAASLALHDALKHTAGYNGRQSVQFYDKVLKDPYRVEKVSLSKVLDNLRESREKVHSSDIPMLQKLLSRMDSLISYYFMIKKGLLSFIPSYSVYGIGDILNSETKETNRMSIRLSTLNIALSSNFNLCVQRFSLQSWEVLSPALQTDPLSPFSYFDEENSYKFKRSKAFEKFLTHYNALPGVNLDDPHHPSNMPSYFYILPMWNVDDAKAQQDLQTSFARNQKQAVQFVAAYLCLNSNMNPINSNQFEMYSHLFNNFVGQALIRPTLPESLQSERLSWETLALEPFLRFEFPVADTFTYYGLRLPVHYVNMFRHFYGPLKRASALTPNSSHPFTPLAGKNFECCRPSLTPEREFTCKEECREFRNRWAYDDQLNFDYTRRVCAVNGQTKTFDPKTAIHSAAMRTNEQTPSQSMDLGLNIFVEPVRFCTKECAFSAGDEEDVSNGYLSFYNNGFYPNFEAVKKEIRKRNFENIVGYTSTARFGDSISSFERLHQPVILPWKANPTQAVTSNLDSYENVLHRVNDFMFFSYKEETPSTTTGWGDSPHLDTFFGPR